MREIILEGPMYDREEMNKAATPLEAQKRSPLAASVAAVSGGICAAAGGLTRLFMFIKEVR